MLKWYEKNRRDLPWRRTHDPYAIWISEIMLQQTQVATVIPYYTRFLNRFPTIRHLAETPLQEVLTFWSGLGYYGRARNVHKAAQNVVTQHQGQLPKNREALLELPGIGRYTVGAILSIAFHQPEPVLDGNVIRVLSRLNGLRQDVKQATVQRELWRMAAQLVAGKNPGDWNQSLMELGATVCTPEEPLCSLCPVQGHCLAYARNWVDQIPFQKKPARSVKISCVSGIIKKDGKFLLAQRPPDPHLGEMWEFPQSIDLRRLEQLLGVQLKIETALSPVRHSIMNRRLSVTPLLCSVLGGRLRKKYYQNYHWQDLQKLSNFPTSSLNHKILAQMVAFEGSQQSKF